MYLSLKASLHFIKRSLLILMVLSLAVSLGLLTFLSEFLIKMHTALFFWIYLLHMPLVLVLQWFSFYW